MKTGRRKKLTLADVERICGKTASFTEESKKTRLVSFIGFFNEFDDVYGKNCVYVHLFTEKDREWMAKRAVNHGALAVIAEYQIENLPYEKWLLPNLSTDCTQFYSVNTSMNRIEKTSYFARFPETYDHLMVCYSSGENCGRCDKCIRQLLTLDYLGLLEKYQGSFPLDLYCKDKPWYEKQLLAFRKEDPFLEEIYRTALAQGVRFSFKSRIEAFSSRNLSRAKGLRNIIRNRLRKLFR